MAGDIDVALRQEIVECQKAKAEFIRWKLIIVASVGVAAFGLQTGHGMPGLLALIPLACVYVDSACLHNDSRILMIAEFLRTSDHAYGASQAYEQYCHEHRDRFHGEGLVLFVSSLVLSLLVLLFGGYVARDGGLAVGFTCVVSGTIGLMGGFSLMSSFKRVQAGEKPLDTLRRRDR